jgi:hypothetical protein
VAPTGPLQRPADREHRNHRGGSGSVGERVSHYRVGSMLLGWKAELMNHIGRTVHVQFVMRIIYTTMTIEFLAWAFKAIEKLQKGFM